MPFHLILRRALRANILPALLLWSVAGLILWSYYRVPSAHFALESFGASVKRGGVAVVFGLAALTGALLPFTLQGLQRGKHRRVTKASLPFFIVYRGAIGVLVWAFYILQSYLFGNAHDARTIACKVAVDLLLFSPLTTIPGAAMTFALADANFDFAVWKRWFSPHWYREKVLPVLIAAWLVWLPAVTVIYALPQGLQFPVQAMIQCFWVLLLTVLTSA